MNLSMLNTAYYFDVIFASTLLIIIFDWIVK